MSDSRQTWLDLREATPERLLQARKVLDEVRRGHPVAEAIRRHPLPGGGYVGKNMLVRVYRELAERGESTADATLLARIRMKPVRTLSGVTTVTVLTKPYPCPGKCIFCPTDVRMPKSYLPDEPGARRGLEHAFDPYQQVASRIRSLEEVGHPTNKVELLVLGGTWSAYRRDYQEWFIQRCLDAMNADPSTTLLQAQSLNETAPHRNVGLVIETRPDHVDPGELAWLRYLGVTKVQLGVQSLDDRILDLNQRGHTVAASQEAAFLLRSAGFKVVAHWMPNLLGSSPAADRQDFMRLWELIFPDEIKIYPNQLLENTELYQVWQSGAYLPYTTQELVSLLADVKPAIPVYCRVNRVIRDIPSTYVVEGNRRTSLRQDVQQELQRRGQACRCVRCREVRNQKVNPATLALNQFKYSTGASTEYFLSYDTPDGQLAGYARLSLPGSEGPDNHLPELAGAALIREVHVLGQSLAVGEQGSGEAQHAGLGARLLQLAEEIAIGGGFRRMAVISAIGTRQYYLRLGFQRGDLYMDKDL